jgi:predicted nucleic acid-binding protein
MVIADTDIFIAALRNHSIAKSLLEKYGSAVSLSAVTAMELYVGAKSAEKKQWVAAILDDHELISLDRSITLTAMKLVKQYNSHSRSLFIADALIAATCLEHSASLLTFNTGDFDFIKGLRLVK